MLKIFGFGLLITLVTSLPAAAQQGQGKGQGQGQGQGQKPSPALQQARQECRSMMGFGSGRESTGARGMTFSDCVKSRMGGRR